MENENYNTTYSPYGYQEPEPRPRKSFAVPAAIVLAGLFIGAAVFVTQGGFKEGGEVAAVTNANTPLASTVPPISASDHILGNPNASIIIIEYSDTECPYCKDFHPIMHKVISEYGTSGRVAWVYRHFPLEMLHKKAKKEAEATECAYELGGNTAFWIYIDKIFTNTSSSDTLDLSLLPKFAEETGLNRGTFESCLSSGKYTNRINEAFDAARAAGVEGTPTSFMLFKGQTVSMPGAQSFASISKIIDGILAEIPGLTQ